MGILYFCSDFLRTSKDFKVNDVRFDFTATSVAGSSTKSAEAITLRAAAATQSFSVTRTVDISEIGDDDVLEYVAKIYKVKVDNSIISVTVSPAGAYTVENLTVTAVGVSGSIMIPSYTMGNAFTLTSGMIVFTEAFFKKLKEDRSVSVTVTGMTDAPAGTTINIRYESDVIFTASLL